MGLTLIFDAEQKIWSVHNKCGLAQIFLDSLDQVGAVVIFPCSQHEREMVLRLACSHAVNFLRSRLRVSLHSLPLVSEIMPDRNLSDKDSRVMMDFTKIDGRIRKGTIAEMESLLERLRVPIIDGFAKSFTEAIYLVIAGITFPATDEDIRLYCSPISLGPNYSARLAFKTNKVFEFWSNVTGPGAGCDLDIIPGYHPIHSGKGCLMINGDTDGYISGETVKMIYSPEESRSTEIMGFDSWSNMNHPFKAIGSSFELSVIRVSILSPEGIDELVTVLKAALAINDKYVSVSGGFDPPYRSPHNRFNDLDIPHEERPHIRGSEARCVWAYKTLEAEGELEKAYVPQWFYDENWLGLYETAECVHGSY